MILSKDFLTQLSQFGLNSYEAKLWTALLSQGVSTAGELSDISNVPRSRTYDVLESLEKKGFIIQKLGKPIKYVALPPEEVLERVKKHIKEDAEASARKMDSLKGSDVLNELVTLHTQGVDMIEPTELSGSLRSRGGIHNHMSMMIKEAEEEILLMTTPTALEEKLQSFGRELEKAHNRGVEIYVLINGEPIQTPEYLNIHIIDNVHARFLIVDQTELLFTLLPDDEVHPAYDTGIWVNTPYFAKALREVCKLAFPKIKN